MKPLHGSFVVEPEVFQKASQHLSQPATESMAVPNKPAPKLVISLSSSTSSESQEEEPLMIQRASRHLAPPAAEPSEEELDNTSQ